MGNGELAEALRFFVAHHRGSLAYREDLASFLLGYFSEDAELEPLLRQVMAIPLRDPSCAS